MNILREISIAALLIGLPMLAAAQAPAVQIPPVQTPRVPTATNPPATITVEAEHSSLVIESGTGRVIALKAPATNVFVADPKVAEVRPASASSLFVFGVGAGHTTVAALDNDGHPIAQYDVTVQPSAFGASQAQSTIARMVPGSRVQVQAQSKGLLLSGFVSNAADSAQALAIAKGYVGEGQAVENQLGVQAPVQVSLEVRVAQISRQVVQNLGVNWGALGNIGRIGTIVPALSLATGAIGIGAGAAANALTPSPTGAGVGFNGVIDALAQDNLARILAEPTLTVMSGQPASFLVGGEFPIPVGGQNGSVTVAFKNFGVMLAFVPTVFSDGRISIHVAPEVSNTSNANSVSVSVGGSAFVIPSLVVSRAETTVELGSGQTFAIAGLLQDTIQHNPSSIPLLGDVPIIGAIFRDDKFNRQQTELVILVTPYIVRPVDNRAVLHLPDEDYSAPSNIERLLYLRQVGESQTRVPVRLPGNAGFIVQ
jgi:pilus assembly protein CpaC